MTSTLDRPDRVRVWRPAELDGMEVVHATDVRTARTHLAASPRKATCTATSRGSTA